ncbi:hypothetical protein AB6A40_000931 [Gnathostoma spinigerum]|uniref:Nuclear pore protein n=1 Tax=Gnathostoma spinigerum TaxID=75299 RepID=A0ABD6EC05_9BILA
MCPSRRKRQLEEHGGDHNYEPTSSDAQWILPLFLPDYMPNPEDALSFYSDLVEVITKKFSPFLQPTEEEQEKLSEFEIFLQRNDVNRDWPRCQKSDDNRSKIFYLLTLNAYRNGRAEEAVKNAKLFLINARPEIETRLLVSCWTILAFTGITTLFSLDEADLVTQYPSGIFPFRMALFFNGGDHQLILNFGSALYQIRSKIGRFVSRLADDDIRVRHVDRHLDALLLESQECMTKCLSLLEDGDVDKWTCCYFLGKIAEKRSDPVDKVLHYYYEAARQLEASGVQYPQRINAKRQDYVEAVELHYRAHACLVKWLLECEGREWTRGELVSMHTFAVGFRSHGVCRSNMQHDSFDISPEVRELVEDLIHDIVLQQRGTDDVEIVVDDVVERVALRETNLRLCKAAFTVCIQRFLHYKALYRLAQLAINDGDFERASFLLFDKLLTRKKSNFNGDNIFENITFISHKDLDRGDSTQFHIYRLTLLALNVASLRGDISSLTSIVRSLCTLYVSGNIDYLLFPDTVSLYRNAIRRLSICVGQYAKTGNVCATTLLSLYDLYRYFQKCSAAHPEKSQDVFCGMLMNMIARLSKTRSGYVEGMEPIDYCKDLQAAIRQRHKRRARSPVIQGLCKVIRTSVGTARSNVE